MDRVQPTKESMAEAVKGLAYCIKHEAWEYSYNGCIQLLRALHTRQIKEFGQIRDWVAEAMRTIYKV